ncbi:thioesterase family protein [Shimia sp. MMG029]|uniref:thioesterase family protein n=1 Tax=Shimia sp. MMG029 TaxID=3021978 RepID=UPI0022FE9738|nr:thioesterase family protein [Shimia sp. MMG029]MDA5556399.1 thioesterase family protein [Shimia sp. MMG029]
MAFVAPFISSPMEVEAQWLDFNGHLNMAYYNLLFDRGVDQVFDQLGLDAPYRAATGNTTFSAEFHLCYLKELHLGDKVTAHFQLLDHDEKSFHFYQELWHEDGWLSATGEGLGLHIDQSGPRVAPMPEHILTGFAEMADAHSALPRPSRVGRQMGIRRKPAQAVAG